MQKPLPLLVDHVISNVEVKKMSILEKIVKKFFPPSYTIHFYNKNDFSINFFDLPKWGSQYGQSTLIGKLFFPHEKGFFVDVGARDGICISNTFQLELSGWSGICIEPHPDLFSKLQQSRKVNCVNAAVSNINSHLEFVKFLEEPYGNSGLLSSFRFPDRLKQIKHEIIKVQSLPLTDILDKFNAPAKIHYLDIDVEGHELSVIKSIDFEKYAFDFIGVETNPAYKNYQPIIDHLVSYSYKPIIQLHSDLIFTNRLATDLN